MITFVLRELVGDIEQTLQIIGDVDFARRPLDLGQALECGREISAQPRQIAAGLDEERTNRARLLIDEREQHVRGLYDLMVATEREGLGLAEALTEFFGEFVLTHGPCPRKNCLIARIS